MRTYLAIVLGVTVFVCGCVPKAELDKALAANRRLRGDLENANRDVRSLTGEKDDLEARLKNSQELIKSRDEDIKILTSARDELKASYEQLAAKYERLLKSPPDLGAPSVHVLPGEISKALQDFAKANPELVEYLADYGMIKLKADLTFEKGSDYVQESAKQALAKFAEILGTQDAKKFNIFVAGHTDDLRIVTAETKRHHPNNWYLSVHRAVSVQQALVGAGLSPERICCMGFGEYHPVEPNKPNKKGNPVNRRVEIWIVPPNRFLTAPAANTGS